MVITGVARTGRRLRFGLDFPRGLSVGTREGGVCERCRDLRGQRNNRS